MFKDLVEYMVKSLVDEPEMVEVTEMAGESSIIVEVRVADEDTGRIIGRKGRVINALRTIVQSLGAKEGKRVTLEVL
jgi:predicted RNA-binding protein YlqC (UPF0109 family)